jgi:hypothetical protein
VQVGSGGTSGMFTDGLETFRLDNLESEVVRGACGAADKGSVSKNGATMSFIWG